jgi:hypothetical protein
MSPENCAPTRGYFTSVQPTSTTAYICALHTLKLIRTKLNLQHWRAARRRGAIPQLIFSHIRIAAVVIGWTRATFLSKGNKLMTMHVARIEWRALAPTGHIFAKCWIEKQTLLLLNCCLTRFYILVE